MDQRRQIDIGFAVGDQFDKAPIDAAILRLLLVDQCPVIVDKAAAAGRRATSRPASVSTRISQLCGPVWRQSNSARIGSPLSSEKARSAAIGAARFARERQFGPGQKERPRQNAGQDRERVDAGIKHPKPTGLPDPGLARMPDPDVFLPFDDDRFDLAAGEETLAPVRRRARNGNARSQTASARFASPPRSAGLSSLTVAPGGFSSSTCLPAFNAASACA